MKPGVEDSSIVVQSSSASASMVLSPLKTTSAIDHLRKAHPNDGAQLRHHRGITCSFNSPIDLPTIVLIVTGHSAHRSHDEVPQGSRGTGRSADIGEGTGRRARPHVRTVSSAFCDPVHSIEHRMPLFAYRGFRKRHHQRKEEAC